MAGLEDRRDARVIEARDRIGFALQSQHRGAGQRGHVAREHLQGDLAIEPRVVGQIDDALAAAAELPHQPVGADVVVITARRGRFARFGEHLTGGQQPLLGDAGFKPRKPRRVVRQGAPLVHGPIRQQLLEERDRGALFEFVRG